MQYHKKKSFSYQINVINFITGKLYAWGMGTSGQLGTGEEEDVDEPALIESKQLKDVKVIRVSGGGQHTIVLALPSAAVNETVK